MFMIVIHHSFLMEFAILKLFFIIICYIMTALIVWIFKHINSQYCVSL